MLTNAIFLSGPSYNFFPLNVTSPSHPPKHLLMFLLIHFRKKNILVLKWKTSVMREAVLC